MNKTNMQKNIRISWNAVARRIVLILMGLFLGLNIYLINARVVLGRQMPMPFGYGIGVVLSDSMEPALSRNDLIIVKECKTPHIGDVVVYESGQQLVVHRLIRLEEELLVTQGDANNAADEPFATDQLRGIVWFRIKNAGMFVGYLKKSWVIAIIFIAAFALEEYSFQKQQEKENEQLQQLKDEIQKLKETP